MPTGNRVLILLIVFSYGCQAASPVATSGVHDVVRMNAVLSESLPPGTSLEEAKRFMESQGFVCSVTRHGSFCESRGDKAKSSKDVDYLYCDRSQKTDGIGLVVERWQIAIVLGDDDTVSEILVSTGLTGL